MKAQTAILAALILAAPAGAQKFYPDDPLLKEPAPRQAGAVEASSISDIYDLFRNTLSSPGERQPGSGPKIEARGINTLGDPMDTAWWERRHYWKPLTPEQLLRGPGGTQPPSMTGKWEVTAGRNGSDAIGFAIRDSAGNVYLIKLDPSDHPELCTAADQISSRIYHALGYHVPDNYLVEFDRAMLHVAPDARVSDGIGNARRMVGADLTSILRRAARLESGRYRATASRALPGKMIGPFSFNGTRSDDVNDTVPHEHRRDLRGLRLAAAWIDHDAARSVNTMDALVEAKGLNFVRHYQFDFDATLGAGSYRPNDPRADGEYLFTWRNAALQFLTFGAYVPPWALSKYPDIPSIGRFGSERFQPDRWVPEYPNPAFVNALPDDDFWIARQIMSITDDDLQVIVSAARYSDPGAPMYVAECLARRRDKIGRYAFARVLPLDRFMVQSSRLVWQDLSAQYGFGGSGPIKVEWFDFNNATGAATPLPGATGTWIPSADGPYLLARLTQMNAPSHIVSVYIRRSGASTEIVGVERK